MASAPRQLHVVLVEPEIHWNAGNAGRTCLAVGATLHLIEPLGFSLAEREVKRAGRQAAAPGVAGVPVDLGLDEDDVKALPCQATSARGFGRTNEPPSPG